MTAWLILLLVGVGGKFLLDILRRSPQSTRREHIHREYIHIEARMTMPPMPQPATPEQRLVGRPGPAVGEAPIAVPSGEGR